MSNMATKKRTKTTPKCQKPGVSAQVWINNNLTKPEVTSCQPQNPGEHTPVLKMSRTEIDREMSDVTNSARCGGKFGNESLNKTTNIEVEGPVEGTSLDDCATALEDYATSLEDYANVSSVFVSMKPDNNTSKRLVDLKRENVEQVDIGDRECFDFKMDDSFWDCPFMDGIRDHGDAESKVDPFADNVELAEKESAGLIDKTFDEVGKMNSDRSSVEPQKSLQKQCSIQIDSYYDNENDAEDRGTANLGDQLRLDFQKAQSLHQSSPQLSLDPQPNQIMDLRSAQSLPQISKDVTFLRKHRRTSSLQLARRMSSDLSTIPEELEKRRSAELEGLDFKNTLPRASTVTNICFEMFEKWGDQDNLMDLNCTSGDRNITQSNRFITKSDTKVKQVLQTTPDLKNTQVTMVTNTSINLSQTNSKQPKECPHRGDNNKKPSIPSKPKMGDKNFQRFKEAGEQIKKSVKTRKHKDHHDNKPPGHSATQDNSKVSKTKPDRSTRKKKCRSKKTRDANCKISRDASTESSQEDVSKNGGTIGEKSKKTSSVYRATKSKGVELFKSLREKNTGGSGGSHGKCNEGTNYNTTADASVEIPGSELQIGNDTTIGGAINAALLPNGANFKTDHVQYEQNTTNSKSSCYENECINVEEIESNGYNSKHGNEESIVYKVDEKPVAKPRHSFIKGEHTFSVKRLNDDNAKGDVHRDVKGSEKTGNNDIKIGGVVKTRSDESTRTDESDKMDDLESDMTDESDRTDTTTSDDYTSSTESSNYTTASDKQSSNDNDGSDKSAVDGMAMQLDWKRRAYSRARDDSEDDREWTERSKRISANLEWLRTEITELKKQDQSLMRQFLQLRSTIHALKRSHGNTTSTTDATSCGNIFPLPSSSSFHDFSRFGSSSISNAQLINNDNEQNSNLGSLDGSSSGNEYLPAFRERTVSLLHSSTSEVPFERKPRTMTFSSGTKNNDRGLYEPGEVAC